MRRIAFLLLVFLTPQAAQAGVVHTTAGRVEGKVTLEKGQLLVDGKPVAWADVLLAAPDGLRRTLPRPQSVAFRNGEIWAVELLGMKERQLEVRSDLFGKQKIDLDQVAVIDLTPRSSSPGMLKPKTLYREKSEPVPGTLLAIEKDKLSLDSPLGVVHLPLSGLTRYVIDHRTTPPPADAEIDEITLVEGSILRGKAKPSPYGLDLEHALLGKVAIPAAAVRSVVRYRPSVIHLAEQVPQSMQTAPLLGINDPQVRMQVVRGNTPDSEVGRMIKGVQIEPKTIVRYALPKLPGQKFRTLLDGVDGARGDVKVRISVGRKMLYDEEWKAGNPARELAIDLPAGDELTIEVDFGVRPRFPCGVVLVDPHVIRTKP